MNRNAIPKTRFTYYNRGMAGRETDCGYISGLASDDADSQIGMENICIAQKSHSQSLNWQDSEIFSGPKQLIYTDCNGHLAIEEETLCQISAVTWKLVIVGIAGPYRCGKSYLMNRLAEKQNGFFVGNSTDAATKGIWVWCKVHPKQEETVLLMLDTEGLNDIKKGNKNHDNKILTLITLLCNVLVYNMTGRFDNDSMGKLSFASQISKWVKFGSDSQQQDCLPLVMPELILCLRDFFLKLEKDIDSPTAYFEECLKDIDGEEEYNAPRQSLRTYFKERNCFIFPMPADEKVMCRLEEASDSELKSSFLEKTEEFKQRVYDCRPKRMLNAALSVTADINGPIFKSILEYHVGCLKTGKIPNIEDAFFTAAKVENEKHMEQAEKVFREKMSKIPLPVKSLEDFNEQYATSVIECLHMFRKRVKMDKDNQQEKELEIQLAVIWEEMKTENSQLLLAKYIQELEKRYNDEFKETKSKYNTEGGYGAFKTHLEKMKMDFDEEFGQTQERERTIAWSLFADKIRDEEMRILKNDHNMTRSERERQIEELKKEHEQTMTKQKEESQSRLDLEVQRLTQLQEERDEENEKQIKSIRDDLQRFRNRGLGGRFKFLFTGK